MEVVTCVEVVRCVEVVTCGGSDVCVEVVSGRGVCE